MKIRRKYRELGVFDFGTTVVLKDDTSTCKPFDKIYMILDDSVINSTPEDQAKHISDVYLCDILNGCITFVDSKTLAMEVNTELVVDN